MERRVPLSVCLLTSRLRVGRKRSIIGWWCILSATIQLDTVEYIQTDTAGAAPDRVWSLVSLLMLLTAVEPDTAVAAA